jgi:hypothetical protein
VSGDGDQATSAESLQKSSLGCASQARRFVFERSDELVNIDIVFASFNREGALTHRREHKLFAEVLGYSISAAESMKSGSSQHDCIELTVIELAQPCVYVAAHRFDHEVGPRRAKLSLSPKTACADDGPIWKLMEGSYGIASNKSVANVFPLANRPDVQAGRELSRQILETVNRKIHAAFEYCVFELLGEQALALLSQFWKRNVEDAVTFGRYDFDFNVEAGVIFLQLGFDPTGLPQRELTPARSDYDCLSHRQS